MKAKGTSISLLITMLLSCFIVTGATNEIYAAESPAMVFGQSGITTRLTKGTRICYGSVPTGYTGSPLWRIGSSRTSSTGAAGAMFVVSEYTWRGPESEIIFNSNPSAANANTYQGSKAQKWCTSFYESAFSDEEKANIVSYDKTDAAGRIFAQDWGASSLATNDKVFFLSADELWRYVDQNYPLAGDINGNKTGYWLRSPYAGQRPTMAGTVGGKVGGVYKDGVNMASGVENGETQPYAARPGFNIRTDNMTMVSAIGAKPSSVGSLSQPAAGTEYKLTFIDSDMTLTAGEASNDGTTVNIPFSGATKAEDVYISAVIVHTGNVLYYGKMAANTESGNVQIPYNLLGIGDELYIFTEKCAAGAGLDYTSDPIRITVPDPPPPPDPDKDVPAPKKILLARSLAKGKTQAAIRWNNVNADRYLVYYNEYGKKLRLTKKANGKTFTYIRSGLKRNTRYRFYVVAQKKTGGTYKTIAKSKVTYMVSSNRWGSRTNVKGIGGVKSSVTIRKGKSLRIRPVLIKARQDKYLLTKKGVNSIRYTSNNPAIATVNSRGVITGKREGTCCVYVQALNGYWRSVKVTVK